MSSCCTTHSLNNPASIISCFRILARVRRRHVASQERRAVESVTSRLPSASLLELCVGDPQSRLFPVLGLSLYVVLLRRNKQ